MEDQAITPPRQKSAKTNIPAWQIGDVILDQYEVRGVLGEGGMGTVYKVYYPAWNRELALKCPRPEIFAQADGKARFIQEAETWTKLGAYPHIVQSYFVRDVDDIPHVFAEYVPGGSLSDWIKQRRLYAGGPAQALSRILDIAIQFAWGLHFAHERGLVHQDVKPANVMMTADGTAKVTDFGLAKARLLAGEPAVGLGNGQQSLLVSSRGMTPAYCSPEQAAGLRLSRRSDIWSWGLSVLEMFVGGVTWRVGVVAPEALASYKALDPARPVMPDAVKNLLRSCFQPEPAARPATMLEVATELQRVYAGCVGRPYPRAIPQTPEIQVNDLLRRGMSLHELGKREEALAAYEQALRLDPNNASVHECRGLVLGQLGRREEALAAYEQALRLDPNDALTHRCRGDMLRELGRREEALAAYEQALRLGLDDVFVYQYRGQLLGDLGRFGEALAAYNQGLRLDPDNVTMHAGRGLALAELGRPGEALAAYEQALRLDPNNAAACMGRGIALGDLGRFEEALAAFERLLRLRPDSAPVHQLRGFALRQLGRLEEAEQAFRRAQALS